MNRNLHLIVSSIPNKPGVYQFFDQNKSLIYIGKAKDLKKRVGSYFITSEFENNKLKNLVNKINDIKYIIVDNESDALLLENNLIKKYYPKYNILLKDDKTYPWIVIKKERFPRVYYTRNIIEDGSQYYGPYTSMYMVKTLLDLIRKLYKLRSCKYNLSIENIDERKFKPCLEFHLQNCNAPCIGNQNIIEYNESIEQIKRILKGNILDVVKHLNKLMHEYSISYNFEEAQKAKNRIEILEKFQKKSCIVSRSISNVDVYSILFNFNYAYVNFIKVIDGAIIQSHNVEIKKRLNESKEDLLIYAIIDLRQKLNNYTNEIIIPFKLDYKINNVKITVPKIGDKKRLLELSERNLKYYRLEKLKKIETLNNLSKNENLLHQIKNDLHLKEIPFRIECFDNSNTQGTNPVSSCAVFIYGKPSKNNYRHFNVKTVIGANDYATMAEIVFRRYSRLIEDKETMPQLIIIDGGKGQLTSAYQSLQKLGLENKISIISIAKRLEEIYISHDSIPLYLDKNSATLKLIQKIRNEAHRFAISFHSAKREKELFKNELENISGIGPKTVEILYEKFKNLRTIKNISYFDLSAHTNNDKAKIIYNHFHS